LREHKIIQNRQLTESTFVVRLERNKLMFQTGQFILLGWNGIDRREYSIYSGEYEDYLEVLVREVEGGKISAKLKKLKAGDTVQVDGPFGFFKFSPDMYPVKKFLFVATGTGVSPFHSFVRSYAELDYKLIHGVRFANEAYDHHDFEKERVTLCTSGDREGDFNGRVTAYLTEQKIEKDTNCFLCGNSEMIYEAFDILTGKGVPVSNIYSEVYF
jgi:ferredoxin/flavodoxin---NADP+ reductase